MRLIQTFLLLLLFSVASVAQYGNDWFNPSQSYVKVKVGTDGIYRLTQSELSSAGWPVAAINPKNIQVFHNGKEEAIFVEGENDLSFDAGDYIEFFGKHNDGEMDAPLFTLNQSDQPHQYMSLYTDTSYYYITYTSALAGKRLNNFYNNSYTGTSDSWIWFKSPYWFTNGNNDQFYDGSPYSSPGYYSEYTEGEGWFGAYISGSRHRKFDVPSEHYNPAGPAPEFNIGVYGKSNPTGSGDIVGGINHKIEIDIDDQVIYEKFHYGYTRIEANGTLNATQIGATTTRFGFKSTYLSKSRHAPSYIELSYPRNLELAGASTFGWEYTGNNSYFNFTNYGGSSPYIYDLTNNTRIKGDIIGSDLRFNTSIAGKKNLFISDSSAAITLNAEDLLPVRFQHFDATSTSYDYLIITHPSLAAGAAEYEAYRESAKGGGYNVLTVYSTDLYEDFYYGLHHPMALRNFCQYFYEQQSVKPKHVLLLGKGQEYQYIRFNYTRFEFVDLVPTWGVPGSDYLFVTDYTPNDLKPAIPIGRVPARNNTHVTDYLDKVKLHEDYTNTNKMMLQMTGGADLSEQSLLSHYQDIYYNYAKGPQLGLDRIKYAKGDAVSVDSSLVAEIQGVINDGVQVVSYFGHGASQVLEVDMGKASQFNNKGKYPLFVFNGCALGNSYGEESLAEEFILQKDVGAISWIASSAFGFINELYGWTSKFYENAFDENYGETIGEIIAQTMDDFQNSANNFNRSQCRQMSYHGDPAIRLYAPELPDYYFDPAISLGPGDVDAEQDSFAINFTLRNDGKAILDTPNVFVSVKYSDGSTKTFGPRKFQAVFSSRELSFWIPNNASSVGQTEFTLTVDYGDAIPEMQPLGETNNTISFGYFMPSNRLNTLYPLKDQIISNTSVTLKVQNNNVLVENDEVYFEIDTTPKFNSPLLQTSPLIPGSNIIEYDVTLPLVDSTDWYWRARFNKPINEGGTWEQSTFAFIDGSLPGWSQGYYEKFTESDGVLMVMDTSSRDLKFLRTISDKYTIVASGSNLSVASRGIRIEPHYYYPKFLQHGIAVVAIEPNRLERFSYPSSFNKIIPSNNWGDPSYQTGDYSGAFWFDMRDAEERDSFVAHIDRIPQDYVVLAYTSRETNQSAWPDTVFKAFESIGGIEIRNVASGEPYGIFGLKGSLPGSATEITANYSSLTDPRDQTSEYSTVLYPITDKGSLTSQHVGPSSSWKEFYYVMRDPADATTDSFDFNIIGVKENGEEDELYTSLTAAQDLSNIDAEVYPNLRIKGSFEDDLGRTPRQLERWTVLYEGVPEGTLDPTVSFFQSHDTIQEGDSITFRIAFKNISDYAMDSVLVQLSNRKPDLSVDTLVSTYYPPIAPNDSFIISYTYSTLGRTGINKFFISVNPDFEQPEERLENNIVGLDYAVVNDNKNPLLDVVFDGIHILNNDIVSPSPTITMTVLDENKFIFIDDPAAFDVQLVYPDGTIENIDVSMAEVTFTPASQAGEKAILEYKPIDLPSSPENDPYELIVKVTDAAGNISSALEYRINFYIVRESSITHFYPYPNPFTTSMQFVYTLTGEEVPDYMKIQIMTISGKIVREITKEELGFIRIGNNVSDFKWDGTDQFGDPLANGVYLYKVTATLNGEDVKNRETGGDAFFTDGVGKLYIMR